MRTQRWIRLITQFLLGQSSVQLLNLISGLLLLRWLSVKSYAQFSIVFAFQILLNMLVDIGFSNSIVALVGERQHDPAIIGKFIRSAKHLRMRMFVLLSVASAIAFPIVTYRQHWGFATNVMLFGAIVTSVFLQSKMLYSAPLIINRQLRPFYSAQLLASIVRLVLCLLLYKLSLLSAISTAWMTSLSIGIVGYFYHRAAKPLIQEPLKDDPDFNKEMLQYIKPLIPGLVFTAFQSQITVTLITVFGRTQNIAEVAALGRLGQLFLILSAANSVFVEPALAKVSREQVPRRYMQILGVGVMISVVISAAAFTFPRPLLMLLGAHYRNLLLEVGWMVLSSCVGYVSGVVWIMNNARKYLSWWYTTCYIVVTLLAQITCVCFLNMSQTHNAILFSLFTNFAMVTVHIGAGVFGMFKDRTAIELAQAPA